LGRASADRTSWDQHFEEELLKVEPGVKSRLVHLAWAMGLGDIGEDIYQETVLRAWRDREVYAGRPGSTPYTFLITIGYRQLIDAQRRKRRRKFVRLGGDEEGRGLELPDRCGDPVGDVVAGETQQRVQQVLGQLKPRDVLVWEMVQAGRSYDEVGEELSLARGTVGTIMHRIRRKLQAALAQ